MMMSEKIIRQSVSTVARSEATQNFVHTGCRVDDFQQPLLLEVIHSVFAALGFDLIDRRTLGNQLRYGLVHDEKLKDPCSAQVTGAPACHTGDFLAEFGLFGLCGWTVEILYFFDGEIELFEGRFVRLERFATVGTEDGQVAAPRRQARLWRRVCGARPM